MKHTLHFTLHNDTWPTRFSIKFKFKVFIGITWQRHTVFSCDQAALWMVFSVRLFVRPSVRLSHLFDYVFVRLWHYKKSLLRSQIYHGYEELSTDTNYPIWRRQKLPYMKKTRKKKQVCGAACFMAAEIKFSEDVRLSHLFDYVPIIVSSWNFQELSHWTRVRSMQKVKVRGQRSRSQRSRPKFSFPDCNSSLNSHMMIKGYI